MCFFFQAEDGIRDGTVTGFRRVLFRSPLPQRQRPAPEPACQGEVDLSPQEPADLDASVDHDASTSSSLCMVQRRLRSSQSNLTTKEAGKFLIAITTGRWIFLDRNPPELSGGLPDRHDRPLRL